MQQVTGQPQQSEELPTGIPGVQGSNIGASMAARLSSQLNADKMSPSSLVLDNEACERIRLTFPQQSEKAAHQPSSRLATRDVHKKNAFCMFESKNICGHNEHASEQPRSFFAGTYLASSCIGSAIPRSHDPPGSRDAKDGGRHR